MTELVIEKLLPDEIVLLETREVFLGLYTIYKVQLILSDDLEDKLYTFVNYNVFNLSKRCHHPKHFELRYNSYKNHYLGFSCQTTHPCPYGGTK